MKRRQFIETSRVLLCFLELAAQFSADPLVATAAAPSVDVKQTATYRRVKAHLDAVPAIDTHDHIPPFDLIRGRVETERGFGMMLHSLWRSSYYTGLNHPLTAWPKSGKFDDWWPQAKRGFDNVRAASRYRHQLPAFSDLYGVDFDNMTDEQARALNTRIFENYRDRKSGNTRAS